jgi:hypothetical protein
LAKIEEITTPRGRRKPTSDLAADLAQGDAEGSLYKQIERSWSSSQLRHLWPKLGLEQKIKFVKTNLLLISLEKQDQDIW